MADKNTLIDLGETSKPVSLLIEKISDAIGVIFEPSRIRRAAKANADAQVIAALAEIDISDIKSRANARLDAQTLKRQINIEQVTAGAIPYLTTESNPEKIDTDWISYFFSKCQDISDAEMQSIWSKILSKEANSAGTFSKRTLDLLSTLEKDEAHLFTRFCEFVLISDDNTLIPFIFDKEEEIFIHAGLTFTALKHLSSIGLIDYNPLAKFSLTDLYKSCFFKYFDKKIQVTFKKSENNSIRIGMCILTKMGSELYSICGAKYNGSFLAYARMQFLIQEADSSII